METMSPQQQDALSHRRGAPGDSSRKRMKSLMQRRQSAPTLVISKALARSRTISRENCLSPVSPETCLLVQSFLTPSRSFIAHTYVQLKTGLQTQERHLFLFTDILLLTKAKSSTYFKLKVQVRVCEMWSAGWMEEVCEGSCSPEKSFVIGWPTCNCVATFSTVEQKEKWLSLIRSRIREEKEKDAPKTIPLKVFVKDIARCAQVKTLAVSNTDNAQEVTRLALQQFGIMGCVKDFQLWVSSKRDNAPYPLIGHEFPYSIQMSHMREPVPQTSPQEPSDPPELQAELIFAQLENDTQCQFVLKPSRVDVGQSFTEAGQKPFKRRRSLISWAFWRGSTLQLDDLPPSPTLPCPGQLFGQPLSAVCQDNALPKPIMEILVFLYQEAPFTRGIFRRSAGAKACRDLRDRIDTGSPDVSLVHESIFVIAAVLKDFLRNIPGSLLSSDLYGQWMGAMDGPAEEEHCQLEAVQSLVACLPSENLLLLKHMLAILHRIQLHAHDNQMNAFNLSVCIAPSMLSAPAASSPEMEGASAMKVCGLVQLMVENCQAVMGEDLTALFRGFPPRCSSDHGADMSSHQMTDSSYDSLENELDNDESGSPFQAFQRPRGKPDSQSRDSVITLSDCDLDQPDAGPAPALARPAKASPALGPAPVEATATYLQGSRRWRRSSEPSVRISTSSPAKRLERHEDRKGSYDGSTDLLVGSDFDNVFAKELGVLQLEVPANPTEKSRAAGAPGSSWKKKMQTRKPPPLDLNTSFSSLCSQSASPTRSSVSSLDSAFSQHSTDFSTSCPVFEGNLKASGNISPCSPGPLSPRSPTQASVCSPGLSASSPRGSSAKETFNWSHIRNSHGLHPNTWLKRDRRLSLHQQDKLGLDGEDVDSCPLQRQSTYLVSDPGPRQMSSSPPSCQQAEQERKVLQKTVKLPPSMFYGQKSHSLIPGKEKDPAAPRRASEPGGAGLDPERTLDLERLHQRALRQQERHGRGLKVSDVDPCPQAPKARICLSPSTTKVVRDYFSSNCLHDPSSSFTRSQEVALALVRGKREWRRRCSDPRLDNLDQMLFAEESYV
ncbi:rho GTPase-activating protein 20-like isoform X2 [Denticeps clupeoides]|uniref:rho GTPase-activating protein 20-like isoform X2 n=1 Tax=Denticeps clupeoides TaxID=299321 RepID=UPI0010A469D4|nr:rho GTPase-activating protein 20-like isoform X2 [Denticeps clupeoides]XP_028836645.1 rho GTPase-activating protein 20-like isoform X2 [Denticeps clupeoides]